LYYFVSYDTDRLRRPEPEIEIEAGTVDYLGLESDVASHQGCYSPVSSVSDMEPTAENGVWFFAIRILPFLFLSLTS